MVICICEDRPQEEVAIKLLLSSLAHHCPDTPVILTYPVAGPAFIEWVRELPTVELRTAPIAGSSGWNIKPYALLKLLDEGRSTVWWLDSDVIVTDNFVARYRSVTADELLLCEEAIYGAYRDDGLRTRGWGLPPGQAIPFSLNTGVMRVTRHHVELLGQWRDLLESPDYQAAQRASWRTRPRHMMGDQDVLTALLGSAPHAKQAMHVLRRGRDIIQYFGFSGYTVAERLGNLTRGLPPFIHCQGWKPWSGVLDGPWTGGVKARLMRLYIELSPYRHIALHYREKLGLRVGWLDGTSAPARLMRLIGFGHPALTGLPLAAAFDLMRSLRPGAAGRGT